MSSLFLLALLFMTSCGSSAYQETVNVTDASIHTQLFICNLIWEFPECGICISIIRNTIQTTNSVATTWLRHQMEAFSALLTICAGNSPVTGEFPAQRPLTRSFDVFFDMLLNKRLSKQSRRRWLETSWHSSWRHCNENAVSFWHFSVYHLMWWCSYASTVEQEQYATDIKTIHAWF